MKNSKFATKTAIVAMCLLSAALTSCAEKVKVVEVQSIQIKIDTIYTYKVDRIDDGEHFYDTETTSKKYEKGETIQIIR